MTQVALLNMRYPKLEEARLPARPVPERVGEPSVFEHIVYVIKENRSYDSAQRRPSHPRACHSMKRIVVPKTC